MNLTAMEATLKELEARGVALESELEALRAVERPSDKELMAELRAVHCLRWVERKLEEGRAHMAEARRTEEREAERLARMTEAQRAEAALAEWMRGFDARAQEALAEGAKSYAEPIPEAPEPARPPSRFEHVNPVTLQPVDEEGRPLGAPKLDGQKLAAEAFRRALEAQVRREQDQDWDYDPLARARAD